MPASSETVSIVGMAIDEEREFDEGILKASAQWMERVLKDREGAAMGD